MPQVNDVTMMIWPGNGGGAGLPSPSPDLISNVLWFLTMLIWAILLWWLLSKLFRSRRPKNDPGMDLQMGGSAESSQRSRGNSEAEREAARRAYEEQLAARSRRLEDAMKAEPVLAQFLQSKAGNAHADPKDVSATRDAALQLAPRMPDELVKLLWLSTAQTDVRFDLAKLTSREEVNYATSDAEPGRIDDLSDLARLLPEDLQLSEEEFYRQAAAGELRTIRFYETTEVRKKLYILMDISGSMGDPMPRSNTVRHVWARGVVASLLFQAIRGEAEYMLRTFNSEPQRLVTVQTPAQAHALLDYVLAYAHSDGGTSILGAVMQAITDLSSTATPQSPADLLLITDGQDHLTAQQLRNLLGNTVRLHAVLIGQDHPALKKVAVSYRVFR